MDLLRRNGGVLHLYSRGSRSPRIHDVNFDANGGPPWDKKYWACSHRKCILPIKNKPLLIQTDICWSYSDVCGSKPWKTPIVIAHPLLCWYDPRGPISSHSNYTWPFLVVYNDTVSRALETAPTEPRFCRVLLPAVDRNAIALCGFVLTMLGIAPPHAAVRPLQCRSTIPWLNYITPTWSPSRTMHLLFSFPSFILPSWCTVACEGCPLFVGRSPCPSHSTSFSLNYRVADVSSDPNLTTCSCLVGSDVS